MNTRILKLRALVATIETLPIFVEVLFDATRTFFKKQYSDAIVRIGYPPLWCALKTLERLNAEIANAPRPAAPLPTPPPAIHEQAPLTPALPTPGPGQISVYMPGGSAPPGGVESHMCRLRNEPPN